MDILGPLPKPTQVTQYVLVMTDRYSKLTQPVPAAKTSATQVKNIFLDHSIIPFGIPNYVLTDNGPQLINKIFATICGYLGVKHLTTTAYRLKPTVR